MNELTPKFPQNLEETLAKYYSAPAPSVEFASRLELQLQRKMQQNQNKNIYSERKTFVKTLRTRPVLIILIALLILFALSGVVYAIGRSLGYIPGVGMVEQGSLLRILEESFSIERENISLTLEQVVASPEKTIIVYDYFVPPFDESAYQTPMEPNSGNPTLVLPDGNRVEVRFGRRMAGDGLPTDKGAPIRYSLEFPPLPANITEVTLELPNLPAIPPGVGPENWVIPLTLVPAPEGFALPVFVVEGIGMDDRSANETAPSSEPLSGNFDALHSITASVDLYIPLEDGYLLIGSMQWSEKDYPAYTVKPLDYIKVTDSTGAGIPFEPVLGLVSEKPQDEEYRSYWAIKVLETSFTTPLQIRIDSATVDMHTTPFSFQFDPGSNPVPGQAWDIDQDFHVGDIQARILKVSLTTMRSPDLIFQFDIQAQPNELADVFISMPIGQCMGGGGGSPAAPYESIQVYTYTCRTDLPPGPLEVKVSGAQIWGPWQVDWTPPETSLVEPSAATIPAQAEACLTRESWQQALKKNHPIPAGLAGRLVLANPSGEIRLANLTGGELKLIGLGDAPSLSPDGSRVAMTGPIINSQPPNGLYVTDLASGNTSLLEGTTNGDSAPLWSPDGTKIAFTRGPAGSIGAPGSYNVMVVNADGTDLRQITSGDGTSAATAWMPDSIHVVYIVRNGLKSAIVNIVDIWTGEVTQLFETNYGYGSVVISPDGKRAAFEDWLPGEIYALYVSNVDGSNRKLLAQGPDANVVIPIWSPDGQWVIASVYDDNSDSKLALIQVDTCQIIPLPYLTGYVGSWLP